MIPKAATDRELQTVCPVCSSVNLKVFFELPNVPVQCNVQWPSRDTAKNCSKGNIKLALCTHCGHITNVAFDSKLMNYNQKYENTLDFSPSFQAYAHALAKRLVNEQGLVGKTVLEIGCGKGDFLELLCELGHNRGVGFDPSYVKRQRHIDKKAQLTFISDFYSENFAHYCGDLFVCRQMLEHVENPTAFLSMLRRTIGARSDVNLFFEVPNAWNIFQRMFVWDIIYEHCSYFTQPSLLRAFACAGFNVSEVKEEYDGQFLGLLAQPRNGKVSSSCGEFGDEVKEIAKTVGLFSKNYELKVRKVRRVLGQLQEKGKRLVLWGSGSKGIMILNTFKDVHVKYAVDINPRKQGRYVAGTGQQIVAPEFLVNYKPDVILLTNSIYCREIQHMVKRFGLSPKFLPI